MAETHTNLPRLNAEQRRAVASQFERAQKVLANKDGVDFDYALQLLFACCQTDPANPTYRHVLRQTQKAKYQHNKRGQFLGKFWSLGASLRLRKALMGKKYAEALVQAEHVLMRSPWDLKTHILMAQAFEGLDLVNLAVWTLEQVRPTAPTNVAVNRYLAQLYEQQGKFQQAIALWEMVRKAKPADQEAGRKSKDLAASQTIARGRYHEAVQGEAVTPFLQTDHAAEQTEVEAVNETDSSLPSLDEKVPKEVASLRERIAKTPNNPLGYLQLASYHRKHDQPLQAQGILREGLEKTNNHFDIAQEMLDLAIEPFRIDLVHAEEKLNLQPNNPELRKIREDLQREINARELEIYRNRSDRFPTDSAARFEMAVRLLKAGQFDESIKELQQLRTDPRFQGKVFFYLGVTFQQRKNWRLAQRNYEDALPHLNYEPDLRKETLYQLAVGNAQNGDLTKAVDLACELANLDYGYKDISNLMDKWQTKVVS